MKKRLLSLILALAVFVGAFPVASSIRAYAADFETQMKNKGFPESYISQLSELHEKYPKWNFEPLDTGETWEEAVYNERTPHSQQVIQMTASNDKRNFYCQCSSCYKNGSYVIQEGKSWVSASESAVAYYMDPRESLDERYIFQFESTAYSSAHTAAGVETILSGTWMHNANISYKDANGSNVTISPAKKYSQAIMEAAKESGMSAYYLASKIVQEVGGKEPTAGGASGTYSGYEGIYNYYNIGANTGAVDGLKWASTSSRGYVTNCNCNMRQNPTTNSAKLVLIPNGTAVTYLGTTPTQPDGYKWYNIKATVSGKTYTGYVRTDLIDVNSTDKWNRPWTDPYLSIINGAKFIANGFGKTQYTGYLQKFNVNPASGSQMHDHEYMANVQAASSEASKTYNAYKAANLLSAEKTFVIPVFKNMPGDTNPLKVKNIQFSEITENSVRISYDHNYSVDGYEIQIMNDKGEWVHYVNTGYSNKVWDGFESGKTYKVRVRTYMKSENGLVFSDVWSDTVSFTTKDYTVQNVSVSEITENTVRISYTHNYSVGGYEIQTLNDNGEWVHYVNTGYSSKVWGGFEPGKTYTIRVRTYQKSDNGLIFSPNWSDTVSFTMKSAQGVKNVQVSDITAHSVRISYTHDYSAGGYEIQTLNDKGEWEHFVNTGWSNKVWDGFLDGTKYTIRVRTYQKSDNGLIFSNAWSDVVTFTTKPLKVQNVKVTDITPYSVRISYDHIYEGGYEIQTLNDNGEWVHFVNTGFYNKVWDGFASGKTYTIRVRTYQKSAGGLIFSPTWSDPVTFTTASDTVKNVKISEIGEHSVRISYDHNHSVGGYEIQTLNDNGEWVHYVNTGWSSKVWGGFLDGTKYTIRVRTYQKTPNGLVFSNNWSDAVSFTTKPIKVQNVRVTEITENSARISYNHLHEGGFEIQIQNDNGEWVHLVNTGYSDKVWGGFESGKTYKIRVRTYQKSEGGLIFSPTWSDTVTFTTK